MDKVREMYHTQEQRDQDLKSPIICYKNNAWLGEGYYFWYDIFDADFWGVNSKTKTGKYQVYKADINCENVLDTVFDEKAYKFWIMQVEKVAKIISSKTRSKPTLKEINQYFKEKAFWDEVSGIMFQDLPISEENTLVKNFFYRKRIQLVVYKINIVCNFVLHKSGLC